jgi:hypothetical protein
LSSWCDTEDAFLKIFTDLWIRGIVTRTDSFALMIMKLPSTISAIVVVLVAAPLVLVIPFAALATMVRMVETMLLPNWRLLALLAGTVVTFLSVLFICLPCRMANGLCLGTAVGLSVEDEDEDFYFVQQQPTYNNNRNQFYCHPKRGIVNDRRPLMEFEISSRLGPSHG